MEQDDGQQWHDGLDRVLFFGGSRAAVGGIGGVIGQLARDDDS
jgi:hypothetical protein